MGYNKIFVNIRKHIHLIGLPGEGVRVITYVENKNKINKKGLSPLFLHITSDELRPLIHLGVQRNFVANVSVRI